MIPLSPLELLDRLTPIQCRAIARDLSTRGRPLTIHEIAFLSGLTPRRASWISRQKSWAKISVEEAGQFMEGCGINLRNQQRHIQYIRRSQRAQFPLAHLYALPYKERRTLLKSLQK